MSKSKEWLLRSRNNASEWDGMFTSGIFCLSICTIKIPRWHRWKNSHWVINTIRSLSSLSINIYFLVPFFFVDRSDSLFSKTMNEDVGWSTTNVFEKSRKALENNSIVILKGRKGTRKTTLAMHLAAGYILCK